MHFDAILGLYSMGNPLTNCAPEQLYSQTFNVRNKTTWKTSYENLFFFKLKQENTEINFPDSHGHDQKFPIYFNP